MLLAAAATQVAEVISIWWTVPFVALLLCTAIIPLINRHWWELHYAKVAIALGLVTAVYYFAIASSASPWLHSMAEYISFIVLLASLYIVSGGIYIDVTRAATPAANCTVLLLGAILSNILGTTGAAMLLIRPFMRMNRGHLRAFHIVFFIFIVANVGGSLTPIGDPPLFLGYLRGVPFWWVFEHCQPMWLVTNGILLSIFFMFDIIDHRKVRRDHSHIVEPGVIVHLVGLQNLLFVTLILFAVFQEGFFPIVERMHDSGTTLKDTLSLLVSRECLMLVAIALSLYFTDNKTHQRNEFGYAAIREVAILFVGIFSTMTPALQWLDRNADRMPLKTPGQFYFTCGALSAVLDNAPTYLTFLKTELGKLDDADVAAATREIDRMGQAGTTAISADLPDGLVRDAVTAVVKYHPDYVLQRKVSADEVAVSFLVGNEKLNAYLIAISLGAVFFGACTYIGNGPNFMVKSIADQAGVVMPSFFGYIFKYALPILVPTYVVVWWIFLR